MKVAGGKGVPLIDQQKEKKRPQIRDDAEIPRKILRSGSTSEDAVSDDGVAENDQERTGLACRVLASWIGERQ